MILLNKFNKLFRWEAGRQISGYSKLKLLTGGFPVPFDLYLLKFPEGSKIAEHVDIVDKEFNHYRINIILKKSKMGGEFLAEHSIIDWDRLKFFRPDIVKHSVTKVVGGSRYVLSIGFLLKKRGL